MKSTTSSTIPAFLSVDVEPDGFQLDRRDPPEWGGYVAMVEYLTRLRADLDGWTGRTPRFGWYVRTDPQIAQGHGRRYHALVRLRAPRLPCRRGRGGWLAPDGAADRGLAGPVATAMAARGAPRAARPRPDRGGGTLSHGPLAQRGRVLGHRRPAAPVDAAALSLARHPHRRGRLGHGGHGPPDLRCPSGASAGAATALREPPRHVSRRTLARPTPGGHRSC